MAVLSNQMNLSGLARRLVLDGLLTEESARQIHDQAAKEKIPFVSQLVKVGKLSALDIAERGSLEFGVPLLDLDAFEVRGALLNERHPLRRREERLLVVPRPHRHNDAIEHRARPLENIEVAQSDRIERAGEECGRQGGPL